MKAYKGFDRNLACRGHQFELGGTYDTGADPDVCRSGFHACLNPLDVLAYYPAADGSRYCEVEVADDAATHDEDSKVASRTIKDGVELGPPGLIKAGLEVVWERVRKAKPDRYTSGDRSTAATSGDRSTAATSGDRSAAATSGDRSTAIATGTDSVALAAGWNSSASGAIGCWLMLVERDLVTGSILEAKAVKVDGDEIKPDVLYTLRDGKVVTR